MREVEPYGDFRQEGIKSQYKIGDGQKCNYSFLTAEELENFFKKDLGTVIGGIEF
jgi:hypothetical protein